MCTLTRKNKDLSKGMFTKVLLLKVKTMKYPVTEDWLDKGHYILLYVQKKS